MPIGGESAVDFSHPLKFQFGLFDRHRRGAGRDAWTTVSTRCAIATSVVTNSNDVESNSASLRCTPPTSRAIVDPVEPSGTDLTRLRPLRNDHVEIHIIPRNCGG